MGLKNSKHVYTINGAVIVPVETIKDLGIYVSNDLSWSAHINEIVNKANRVCNVILHAFVCHSVELHMSAFETYVKPILDYCCFIWNPTLFRDIDKIENVQRAFTRRHFAKCGLPRMDYCDRIKILQICSIERDRFVKCLTMFHKIYHKFVVCNVLNDFTFPLYLSHLRGHDKRLFVPLVKKSVRKSYFVFRFARVWNSLPQNVVSSNVSKAFCCRLGLLNLSDLYDFRF